MLGRQCPGPAELIMGLHFGRMAEDEVGQRGGRRAGVRVGQPGPLEDLDHRLQRLAGSGAQRVPGGHQLGTVAMCQQRCSESVADRVQSGSPVTLIIGQLVVDGDGAGDLIGHRGQQHLLVDEVPVQAAGLHTEFAGEPSHGQVAEAVLVEDRERALQHGLPGQPHGLTVAQSRR